MTINILFLSHDYLNENLKIIGEVSLMVELFDPVAFKIIYFRIGRLQCLMFPGALSILFFVKAIRDCMTENNPLNSV